MFGIDRVTLLKIFFLWMPFAFAGFLIEPFVPLLHFYAMSGLVLGTFIFGFLVIILQLKILIIRLISTLCLA